MAKYRSQWGFQVLLILIGIATAVIPNIDSWTPFIVLVSISILWFIISFIYFLKNRKRTIAKELEKASNPLNPKSISNDKLVTVVNAIKQAIQTTPKDQDIVVYRKNENGLLSMYPRELRGILMKLENDEKILKLKSFPEFLLLDKNDKGIYASALNYAIGVHTDKDHFVVTLTNKFDEYVKKLI